MATVKGWGFLGRKGPTSNGNHKINTGHVLQWEDFEHTATLSLGDSGATSIIFPIRSFGFDCLVLKRYPLDHYTEERRILVEMTLTNPAIDSFLATKCVFSRDETICVGSEMSDMSLADIIDCNIPLKETHVSMILSQVRPSAPSRCV